MRIQHPTIYLIRHFSNSGRAGGADAEIIKLVAFSTSTQHQRSK